MMKTSARRRAIALVVIGVDLVACAAGSSSTPVVVPPVTEGAPTFSGSSSRDAAASSSSSLSSSIADEDPGPTFSPNAGEQDATVDPASLSTKDNVFITTDLRLVRAHPKLKELEAPINALTSHSRIAPTGINVMRDVDLVVVTGDSLAHTQNNVMTVTFTTATSDAAINKMVRALSSGYAKGGPFDAGASPPVSASLAMIDFNERALLRPRSKLLVVVPPARAGELGAKYANGATPRQPASNTEALVISLKEPGRFLSLPKLTIPSSVTAMRFSVVPRAATADAVVFLDATCTDEAAAKAFATAFNASIGDLRNSLWVKLATHDALRDAKLVADKTGHAKLALTLSDVHVQTLVGLIGAFVGTAP